MFKSNPAIYLATALLVSPFITNVTHAQNGTGRSPMTRDECRAVAVSIDSGNFIEASRLPLEHCGDIGPAIVAKVIKGTDKMVGKSITMSSTILSSAGSLRDVRIFNAALEVARNPNASILARLTNLYLLGLYYDKDITLTQPLNEIVNGVGKCSVFGTGFTHRQAKEVRPLPSDANSIIASTLETVGRDPNESPYKFGIQRVMVTRRPP